ncbi:MAG: hypothetical protein IJV88_05135 [Ruminococcus sp.]|nr:hypothetical protein [Ruminococcus sp.]
MDEKFFENMNENRETDIDLSVDSELASDEAALTVNSEDSHSNSFIDDDPYGFEKYEDSGDSRPRQRREVDPERRRLRQQQRAQRAKELAEDKKREKKERKNRVEKPLSDSSEKLSSSEKTPLNKGRKNSDDKKSDKNKISFEAIKGFVSKKMSSKVTRRVVILVIGFCIVLFGAIIISDLVSDKNDGPDTIPIVILGDEILINGQEKVTFDELRDYLEELNSKGELDHVSLVDDTLNPPDTELYNRIVDLLAEYGIVIDKRVDEATSDEVFSSTMDEAA